MISRFNRALAAGTTLVLTALLLSAFLVAPALERLLLGSESQVSSFWRQMPMLLSAANLLALWLPAWLLYALASRRRHRVLAAVLVFLGALYVLADADLYSSFGRHLSDLIAYARLSHGGQAAGDIGFWVRRFLVNSAWALVTASTWWGCTEGLSKRSLRLPTLVRVGLALPFLCGSLLLPAAPSVLASIAPDGYGPRLYGSLAIRSTGSWGGDIETPKNPSLRKLQEALQREYSSLFGYFYAPPRIDQADLERLQLPQDGPTPNVSIVVAESLRWEQLTPQLMPRLWAYSKKGLRLQRHYAASNHSEAGLFTLLYGHAALNYDTTLDAQTEPTLFRVLRQRKYRIGYYTGHPEQWLRREEFLNDRTLDDYQRDDRGTWNDWDERALRSAARALERSGPGFALTFLMSSHYEYRYPARYSVDRPDSAPQVSWLPAQARPEEYESGRNRYRNVTRYLDDLFMDHVDATDDGNTIFVFTGDHGEATGENHRFGHGYDFSDPLTRVPFVMVGPGIEPGAVDSITSHQDLMPTLTELLGGHWPDGTVGQPVPPRKGRSELLQSYTQRNHPVAKATLLLGDLRLALKLSHQRPELSLIGFEDATGQAITHIPSDREIDELSNAFRRQLEIGAQALPR